MCPHYGPCHCNSRGVKDSPVCCRRMQHRNHLYAICIAAGEGGRGKGGWEPLSVQHWSLSSISNLRVTTFSPLFGDARGQSWTLYRPKSSLLTGLYWDLVLASFVSTWHSWSYHRERSFSWGNASIRCNCKAFSQLVIKGGKAPCGWDHLRAGSHGSIRKQAEQARWGSQ